MTGNDDLYSDDLYAVGSLERAPVIAAMIGEFVAAWGLLEQSLRLALANVLDISIDASEAILYALRNSSSKLEVVADVTRRSEHSRKDEILDALSEIHRLSARRNHYLHALLAVGPNNQPVTMDFRYRVGDPLRKQEIKSGDLTELTREVRDAYNFLALALHNNQEGLPAWQSKYFQQRPVPGQGSKRKLRRLSRKREGQPQSSQASPRK
jgi:predicted Zn-ribbon and HTH transcriptional regulator